MKFYTARDIEKASMKAAQQLGRECAEAGIADAETLRFAAVVAARITGLTQINLGMFTESEPPKTVERLLRGERK